MPNRNIKYRSRQLLDFYKNERKSWDKLYPSEKVVFERVAGKCGNFGSVLDVGCACGGLGKALSERFKLSSYTGVDIHEESIEWAKRKCRLPVPAAFIAADILDFDTREKYDTVISLGCADWNIETDKIITCCWKKVKPGGCFVVSLRLTPDQGVNDIESSYQCVNFSGKEKNPEIANYVVLNFKDTVRMIKRLNPRPASVCAYGYWGTPSSMARTPFERIVFSVFYIKKSEKDNCKATKTRLDLPI